MEIMNQEEAKAFLKKNNIRDAKGIEDALIKQYAPLIQAALEAEMDEALGYSKYDWRNKEGENSRNGHSKKTIQTSFGKAELDIPRDTNGEFEPVIVKKHERTMSIRIEDVIFSLYARGMSMRDINAQMHQIYGVDLSAESISRITDKVLPVAREWQERPLDEVYAIVYLDGIVFNVNQEGRVVKKTGYIIYGLTVNGMKEILGIWIGEAESSKFWMNALVNVKNRGVKDILIAAVDGLKGFIEAIGAVFPKTEVQKCVVHQIRTSTKFVSYKDLKQFCEDMKPIYHAPNEAAGLEALGAFEEKWGKKYAYAVKSWKDNWAALSTFYKYPEEIRRMIYTTNPIEGINRRLRKVTKTKGSFPSDDALFKLLYLVVMEMTKKWTMPVHNWGTVVQQLGIYFGERIEPYIQNA